MNTDKIEATLVEYRQRINLLQGEIKRIHETMMATMSPKPLKYLDIPTRDGVNLRIFSGIIGISGSDSLTAYSKIIFAHGESVTCLWTYAEACRHVANFLSEYPSA